MSRTKKSRKPSTAPKAKPKLSKEALASVEKRVRKKTGNKPGNRQQEALANKDSASANQQNKDPRLGSKTPIDLGGNTAGEKQAVIKPLKSKSIKESAIAAIRYAEPEQDFAKELADIESDETLLAILAKQDEGIELTEQEVDLFNSMMERHQELVEKLGLDDEEESEELSSSTKSSEDDLWDKLDNASDDFSKFE